MWMTERSFAIRERISLALAVHPVVTDVEPNYDTPLLNIKHCRVERETRHTPDLVLDAIRRPRR